MSDRRVKLILEAQVDRYRSAMAAAARSTEELEKAAKETDSSVAKRTLALRELETPLLAVGAASVAGLGLSTKAAMDWESAWAGVMKTVDATPAQYAELEAGLRSLAKELPATHQEIAGVAEAAGQLGVARDDILGFTRTMIDLGESTNLTAEEAATSIAQISNVMGTMEREGSEGVARFGATLVELGNNGASTEADILSMAQRIAGAGATVGATETDVLALSNTLASMGVKAELGGGVATRVLLKMRTAVDEGGESLSTFAQTAGVSADEFAAKFRSSPMEALQLVAGGINDVNAAGGNVTATLKDMGIKGTEETQVMLALANSGDLLTKSLDMGADAWKQNSALVDEAAQRYATTESRIKVAWNTIKDAAITAGGAVLPTVASMAEAVAGLVGWFSELPTPVQNSVLALAGIAGLGAGALGLFVKLAPAVGNAHKAFRVLAPAGGRADRALRGAGKAAGIAGAAMAIMTVHAAQFNKSLEGRGPGEYATQLIDLADASTDINKIFSKLDFGDSTGVQLDGIGDAIDKLNPKWNNFNGHISNFGADVLGIRNGSAIVKEEFEGMDQALASAVTSGNMDLARDGFKSIEDAAREQGVEIGDLRELFPEYFDSLKQVDAESRTAAGGSEVLDEALAEVGVTADGVVESMGEFLEQLFEAGVLTRTARDAEFEFEASLRSVDEAVKTVTESEGKMGEMLNKNKTDFNRTTEAGQLANDTFHGIADAGTALTMALAENGAEQEEVQGALQKTYDSLVKAGEGMGLSEDAAIDLAREVLQIPNDVDIESWMSDQAKRTAEQTKAAVNAVDGMTATVVTTSVRNEITRRWTENGSSGGTSLERKSYGQGRRAYGGPVVGPGTETSDSIPMMLSNGEYVLTAADVRAMGGPRAVDTMRTGLHGGAQSAVGMLAGGGRGAPIVSGRDMVSAANQGPQITVNYYVSNPVAEPASKTTESVSSHLTASLGGI